MVYVSTLPDVALPTQLTFTCGTAWSPKHIRLSHAFMHGVPTEWGTLLPFPKYTLF